MKLNSGQIDQAVSQFPAQPIPDNHPAAAQLEQVFGSHTFFVDQEGLHIVEAVETSDGGRNAGKVIKLASWSDASRTSLAPHEPEESEIVIVLDTAA